MRNIPLSLIANHLQIPLTSSLQLTGYQIDSRLILPGNLFFAIKGEKTDGHAHLLEAQKNGALAAVVSSTYHGPSHNLILLPVPDPIQALQHLARTLISLATLILTSPPLIIGITGSLGKTTTKEFTSTLLSEKYLLHKTHLNFNTKLTYPITLLNRMGNEDILVLELGMTDPGDIAFLTHICPPDIGVLTKIAWVHGSHFENGLPDIAKGKSEIFSHPKTKTAIFDYDLHQYPHALIPIHGKAISFSTTSPQADYFLSPEYFVDERGVRAFRFDPPFKQAHILHNFLAAIAIARTVGMEWHEIERAVSHLQLPPMRCEQKEKNGVIYINDAYNANPDSMRAALSHLPEPAKGCKKIAVLGMMIDMGPDSENIHKEVGRFAHQHVDHLLVIGEKATPILHGFEEGKKPAEQYFDFEKLAERLSLLAQKGDVVLVKASRCVQMEKLFELSKI